MNDHVIRVMAREASLRGLACITTELTTEAARRHETTPLATAVLGQGLTGVSLLGALLKVKQRVALKVDGDGPAGKLVVESDAYGRVRGYVSQPFLDGPLAPTREEMARALGHNGIMTITKDLRLKDLVQGMAPLQSGELDKDLTHHLEVSEQLPSLVEIGVRMTEEGGVGVAGGLLIQVLPGYNPAALQEMVNRLDDLPRIGQLLSDGMTPQELLAQLFGAVAYEVLESRPLEFRCLCSRERSRQALTIAGQDEVTALIEEGEAIINCHFCHEQYLFDRAELQEILTELQGDTL